jgi:hypothetical protein
MFAVDQSSMRFGCVVMSVEQLWVLAPCLLCPGPPLGSQLWVLAPCLLCPGPPLGSQLWVLAPCLLCPGPLAYLATAALAALSVYDLISLKLR